MKALADLCRISTKLTVIVVLVAITIPNVATSTPAPPSTTTTTTTTTTTAAPSTTTTPTTPLASSDCTKNFTNQVFRIKSLAYRGEYLVLKPDTHDFAYLSELTDLEAIYPENGAAFFGIPCFDGGICLRSAKDFYGPWDFLVATNNHYTAPTDHTYWINKNRFWIRDDRCGQPQCYSTVSASYKRISSFEVDVESNATALKDNFVQTFGGTRGCYSCDFSKSYLDGSVFPHRIICTDPKCADTTSCRMILDKTFLAGSFKARCCPPNADETDEFGMAPYEFPTVSWTEKYMYYYSKFNYLKAGYQDWDYSDMFRFHVAKLNISDEDVYVTCSYCNANANTSLNFTRTTEVTVGRNEKTTVSIAFEMAGMLGIPDMFSLNPKLKYKWTSESLLTHSRTEKLVIGPISVPPGKEVVIFGRQLVANLPESEEKLFGFVSRHHKVVMRPCNSQNQCNTNLDLNNVDSMTELTSNP